MNIVIVCIAVVVVGMFIATWVYSLGNVVRHARTFRDLDFVVWMMVVAIATTAVLMSAMILFGFDLPPKLRFLAITLSIPVSWALIVFCTRRYIQYFYPYALFAGDKSIRVYMFNRRREGVHPVLDRLLREDE